MAQKKKTYTKKEKEAFAAQQRDEFNQLVEWSKNGNAITRAAAQKELNKRRKRADSYLRKNEPAKWAAKLRAKADYYDQKAKELENTKK